MKTKLTLTIDSRLSHRAKALARQRGSSLSQWVEDLLAEEVGAGAPAAPDGPFSRRWKGRMVASAKDDPRSRKLKGKYGIEPQK